MTLNHILKLLETLASRLGTSPERMVGLYKPWVLATGISYTLLGGLILGIGFTFFWIPTEISAAAGLLLAVLIGGMFISENVGDIVAPEAAAITKILGELGDMIALENQSGN